MFNLNDLAHAASAHLEICLFYLTAFIMIPLAYGVLLDRNIIRAGFLLIGVFGGISALFLLLQAQFLAMAQLMIYAVGITLVVVIALMLTNPNLEYEKSVELPQQQLPAFLTSILVFLVLYMSVLSEAWPVRNELPSADNIKVLGTSLLTQYSLPFEFASILLLVALIGAVMLAKSDHFHPGEEILGNESISETEGNENVVKV
ncbi:MAG: NADH-quinone oxidoreductase subunit J [Candidatus Obscuribacterales bacterium]|nr:NADH-quinone oxidoreductase subunit J [Candidatus Obscuribacterales bacterium]